MDGIRINNVSLFLSEVPYRKSLAFVFQDGVHLYPVAYVNKKNEALAREYWQRFLEGDTAKVVK
jgi:hypothetical protein